MGALCQSYQRDQGPTIGNIWMKSSLKKILVCHSVGANKVLETCGMHDNYTIIEYHE